MRVTLIYVERDREKGAKRDEKSLSLVEVSHSRGTAWRLALAPRAKVLGSLGSKYIARVFTWWTAACGNPEGVMCLS